MDITISAETPTPIGIARINPTPIIIATDAQGWDGRSGRASPPREADRNRLAQSLQRRRRKWHCVVRPTLLALQTNSCSISMVRDAAVQAAPLIGALHPKREFRRVGCSDRHLIQPPPARAWRRFCARLRYIAAAQFFMLPGRRRLERMRSEHQFGPNCPGKFSKPPWFCVNAGPSEFRL